MRNFLANVFLFMGVVLFLTAIYCRYERPVFEYMDLLFFSLASTGVCCALNSGNSRLHIHQVYPKQSV